MTEITMRWREPFIIFFDDIIQRRGIHRQASVLHQFYQLPPPCQTQIQAQQLTALLEHAGNHVAYYREILQQTGVMRSDGHIDLTSFPKLPFLTKDVLREKFETLKSDDLYKRKWRINATGGSTGEPVRFIQDAQYSRLNKATQIFRLSTTGYRLGDPYVQLWGSERDIRREAQGWGSRSSDFLRNHMILNCFTMSPADMERYTKILSAKSHILLHGYVDGLYELSKYINSHKIIVRGVKAVVSSAGTLYPSARNELEKAFHCKVYNHYGSRELGGIAFEDWKADALCINTYSQLVEVVDDNGNLCKPGEEGEVVVTNLSNYAMPFIRYRIGDTAIVKERFEEPVPSVVAVTQVTGRVADSFVRRDGTIVSAAFFIHFIGVVHNSGWAKKVQIIQIDYDRIKVKLLNNQEPPKDTLNELEYSLKKAMGENCIIEFEFVKELPPSASGKYRYTMSFIQR